MASSSTVARTGAERSEYSKVRPLKPKLGATAALRRRESAARTRSIFHASRLGRIAASSSTNWPSSCAARWNARRRRSASLRASSTERARSKADSRGLASVGSISRFSNSRKRSKYASCSGSAASFVVSGRPASRSMPSSCAAETGDGSARPSCASAGDDSATGAASATASASVAMGRRRWAMVWCMGARRVECAWESDDGRCSASSARRA